jgi:ATP-dependent RNA helicase HelY
VKAGRLQLRQDTAVSLTSLVPGDVIVIQTGKRAGPAVILDPGADFASEPRPLVLTMQREVRRLSVSDFTGMVLPVERIKIPRNFDARSSRSRQELVNVLRKTAFDAPMPKRNRPSRESDIDIEISALRTEMRGHSCHGCSDREEHARWSERYFKLIRERDTMASQIAHRVNVISRDFERVCNVLNSLGYIEGSKSQMTVTDSGKVLRRVHAESELVITEALRRGIFVGLDAAELASAVSVLVYESRGDDDGGSPKLPFGKTEDAITELFSLWQEIHSLEAANKLNSVRKPDGGFAWAIYRWASGGRLTGVLRDSELSAGDFVRTTRRLIDVLEQIAAVGDKELSPIAHESVDLVRRGIVSAAELED